ncbi:hypothetical protein T484DRAFT_1834965 [Baffinella frigidus]|nr:hypothetical protein T484DRAFT_1834965 [Cryptophyta sp. CCMP2293]
MLARGALVVLACLVAFPAVVPTPSSDSRAAAGSGGHVVAVPPGGHIPDGAVEMPTGVTVPFSKMSEATRRARATGQTVSVDVDDQAQPTGASEAAGATTLHRGGAAWDTTMSRKVFA